MDNVLSFASKQKNLKGFYMLEANTPPASRKKKGIRLGIFCAISLVLLFSCKLEEEVSWDGTAPPNFKVTRTLEGIALSWGKVSGADSYVVYFGKSSFADLPVNDYQSVPGSSSRTFTTNNGTLNLKDLEDGQDVKEGQTYYFVVTASKNITGKRVKIGAPSKEVELTLQASHFDMSGAISSVAFSKNCNQLLVAAYNHKALSVFDLATGAETKYDVKERNNLKSASYSPDGSKIVANIGRKEFRVWDATTRKILFTSNHGGRGYTFYNVAFSSNGAKIASVFSEIKIWNATTGELEQTITDYYTKDGKKEGAIKPSFAFYDNTIVAPSHSAIDGSDKGKVLKVWDITTGKVLQVLQGHTAAIATVAFSSDGKTVGSIDYDGVLKLWRKNGAKWKKTRQASTTAGITPPSWRYQTYVISPTLAFSPDSKFIAVGGGNKEVSIYDIATGTNRYTFKDGHTKNITALAFSPDGQKVASGSEDKTVRIWDLPDSLK